MLVSITSWLSISLGKTLLAFSFSILAHIIACSIYNLYLHPLAHIPGPWLARLSPSYSFFHAYKGDTHLDIQRCHRKYGPIVRYHPSRILFSSDSAMKRIYAPHKAIQKSNGYSPHPYYPGVPNLFSCTDKKLAAKKKYFMGRALNDCLASANEVIMTHSQTLNENLLYGSSGMTSKSSGSGWGPPTDMSDLTYFFMLDCLWSLIFGDSLQLMTESKYRWLVKAFTEGNSYMYMQLAWPNALKSKLAYWLNPARLIYPDMANDGLKFDRLAESCRGEREAMTATLGARKDITGSLKAGLNPKPGMSMGEDEMWTELFMLVRAGGDTTSTALSATLFYLSRNPQAYQSLSSEIRTTFLSLDSIRRGPVLSSCQYLRACIDESMRLAPSAPGSFWRLITEDGFMLDGVNIPQGCEAGVGLYALFHNETYFPDPWSFKPERFLPDHGKTAGETLKSDTVSVEGTDRSVFVPFLLGLRRCPAQELAYLQLTLCLARMVWELDFESAGELGQGGACMGLGREREDEFQLRDIFATDKEGPLLRFRRRKA